MVRSCPGVSKWYEQFDEISSALFSWENSGQRLGNAPPYIDIMDDDSFMVGIKPYVGMDQLFRVVGYTEDPPFPPRGYVGIGIMFEDTTSFEKTWWHYSKE